MQITYQNYPTYLDRRISLCDREINRITYSEDSIQFHFSRGFYLIDNNQLISTKNAYVNIENCPLEEFFCYLFTRKATSKGALLYGEPLSIAELSEMLSKQGKTIELFWELYDFNALHWRGTVHPCNELTLSDCVVLEIAGNFPLTFYWEDEEGAKDRGRFA